MAHEYFQHSNNTYRVTYAVSEKSTQVSVEIIGEHDSEEALNIWKK